MKKTLIIPLLIGAAMAMTGCTVSTNSSGQGTGSLFKSETSGVSWVSKSSIMGTTRVGSFATANIWTVELDPTDTQAVYAGTTDNGLFWSYNSGESWQWASSLGKVFVRSVAIDPQYRCTIFVASANKLLRSIDCGRTFVQTYYDNDTQVTVNSVVTDPKDGSKVYLATSRGEIIKSSDRGSSWRTINRFNSKVNRLFINPKNGNYLYAATTNDGLSVSLNGGSAWQSLENNLKKFDDGVVFKDMAFSGESDRRIFIATRYGILKSDDNGATWAKIELITPEDKATINAIAVDPTNDDKIYYTTNTTFYNSKDAGKNWTTKKLPIARIGWDLAVNPDAPNVIYMGMRDADK